MVTFVNSPDTVSMTLTLADDVPVVLVLGNTDELALAEKERDTDADAVVLELALAEADGEYEEETLSDGEGDAELDAETVALRLGVLLHVRLMVGVDVTDTEEVADPLELAEDELETVCDDDTLTACRHGGTKQDCTKHKARVSIRELAALIAA